MRHAGTEHIRINTIQAKLVWPAYLRYGATLLVAVLCLIPGLLFSRAHVTDGFLYQVIAYVQLTLGEGHLTPFIHGGYSYNFIKFLPGYPTILSIFSRLGSLPPEQLHFMPIAAVLLPASYFALSKRMFESNAIATLFALYGAYDIGLASHYNVFAYTWSNAIFFGFLMMSLRVIEQKKISDIVILLVLFGGSLFLHYASTMWMMVFMFILNGMFFYGNRFAKSSVFTTKSSFAMPFLFVILFLTFNQMFFEVWLPSFERVTNDSASTLSLFFEKIDRYLGGDVSASEPYLFLNQWGEGFGRARLLQYAIILAPIMLWCLSLAFNLVAKKGVELRDPHQLMFAAAVVGTAFFDWFVYGSHLGINMRYMSLVFPFVMIIALKQLSASKWLQLGLLAALAATAITCYTISFQYYASSPVTSYGQTRASTAWFFDQQAQGTVLSDLETFGLFLVNSSSDRDTAPPSSVVYDSKFYDSVVNPSSTAEEIEKYKFVLVDAAGLDKPLHGFGNKNFEPFSYYLDQIQANRRLNRIYDDGSVWIYLNSPGANR